MLWVLVIAAAGAAVLWSIWPRRTFSDSATVEGLSGKFAELLNGAPKPRALILETGRNGAFVQFAHESELHASFPLVTPSNRELESRFREVLSAHGLSIHNAVGSDGAQFLEVKLPEEPAQATSFAQIVLLDVFDLEPKSQVRTTLLH